MPKITLGAEAHKRFRRAVGKLMFLLPCRPGLSFTVKELSRSGAAPTLQDEVKMKRCLRYLKGSRNLVLRLTWHQEQEATFHLV